MRTRAAGMVLTWRYGRRAAPCDAAGPGRRAGLPPVASHGRPSRPDGGVRNTIDGGADLERGPGTGPGGEAGAATLEEAIGVLRGCWRSLGVRRLALEWELSGPTRLGAGLAGELRSALRPALRRMGAEAVFRAVHGGEGVAAFWFVGWDAPRGPVSRVRAEAVCLGALERSWPELAGALGRLYLSAVGGGLVGGGLRSGAAGAGAGAGGRGLPGGGAEPALRAPPGSGAAGAAAGGGAGALGGGAAAPARRALGAGGGAGGGGGPGGPGGPPGPTLLGLDLGRW